MKTRQCRNCFNPIARGIRSCPHCGKAVTTSGPALLLVLLLGLGAGAVALHDLRFPAESWILHRFTGQPADLASTPVSAVPPPAAPEPTVSDPGEGLVVPAQPASVTPAAPVTPSQMPVETLTTAPHPALTHPPAPSQNSPLASSFKPPKPGTAVRVKLASGAIMAGTLKTLSAAAIELEKENVAMTLSRAQLAPESRIYFFAADHAAYEARRATAATAAAQPAPTPSPPSSPTFPPTASPSTPATPPGATPGRPLRTPPTVPPDPSAPAPVPGQKDMGDVFFDAFSK